MTYSIRTAKTIIEYVLDLSFLLCPLAYERRKRIKIEKNSQLVKYFTLSKVMYRSGHKSMNTLRLSGLRYDVSQIQEMGRCLKIFFLHSDAARLQAAWLRESRFCTQSRSSGISVGFAHMNSVTLASILGIFASWLLLVFGRE